MVIIVSIIQYGDFRLMVINGSIIVVVNCGVVSGGQPNLMVTLSGSDYSMVIVKGLH